MALGQRHLLPALGRVLPLLWLALLLLSGLVGRAQAATDAAAAAPAATTSSPPAPSAAPVAAPPTGTAGVLTVGLLAERAPLQSWAEGGQPAGLDVAVLQQVAKAAGLSLRFQRYADHAALWQALRQGEVRLLASGALHQPGDGALAYTQPFALLPVAMLAPARLYAVPSTPDLAGRRLALLSGAAATGLAENRYPLAARAPFHDVAQAVAALAAGDADLLPDVAPVLQQLSLGRSDLRVLPAPLLSAMPRRLVALPKEAALIAQLDKALAGLGPQALQALSRQWLAVPAAPVAAAASSPLVRLRVGYESADWPYTSRNDAGVPEGLGVAMVQALAKRANVEVAELVAMSGGEGVAALASGRIDLLMGAAATAANVRTQTLVGPYQLSPLGLVTRERYSYSQLHLMAGRRVAVPAGLAVWPLLPQLYPTLVLVPSADEADGLDRLAAGSVDAVLTRLQGLPQRLRARGDEQLRLTGQAEGLFEDGHLALAPAQADLAPRLRQALDQVLLQDLDGLEQAWADRRLQPGVPWERVRKYVMAATIALVALVLGWFWHGQVLRREEGRTAAALQRAELYLAFLAHDVRNALQSVVGALALWHSGKPTQLVSPQALAAALARSAATTVGQLDGLLDQHRLQSGTLGLQRRPEALGQVLQDIVDEVTAVAQARGQQIMFQPPVGGLGWWQVDAFRLQQVLRNLLSHALRADGVERVALDVAMQHSPRGAGWGQLVVAVRDQGPVLDELARSRLFDVDDAGDTIPMDAPPIPVTNRGMRLARDLTVAMGGRLEVQSPPGRGNWLILHLNLQAASGLPAAAADGAVPHLKRVLLVEDDPGYGLLLQEALLNEGITTVLVDSVAAAGDRLAESGARGAVPGLVFDLVLCDNHLPDGGLAELLALGRQRRARQLEMPPVVGMSADFDTADITRLSALGALDLLTKDADLADLVRRLQRSWVGQAEAEA